MTARTPNTTVGNQHAFELIVVIGEKGDPVGAAQIQQRISTSINAMNLPLDS